LHIPNAVIYYLPNLDIAYSEEEEEEEEDQETRGKNRQNNHG
jgi:hypothetical protein